jgi:Ser/Thr protein kinase RdoA (MazF antagonist)
VIHGDIKPDNVVVDFTRISDWLQVHRAWTSADMAGATVYLLDCESYVEGAFAPAV